MSLPLAGCSPEVRDKGFFVKKVSYKQIDDPTDAWDPADWC